MLNGYRDCESGLIEKGKLRLLQKKLGINFTLDELHVAKEEVAFDSHHS